MPNIANSWPRLPQLAPLAAAVALAASNVLTAQTGLLPPYWPTTDVRVWSEKANHPGLFGRMVTANISDFGYPDAVFLVGQEVMLMTAPALMLQIDPLPGTGSLLVNDLCNISKPNSDYTLALCGFNGLTLWRKGASPNTMPVTGSSWVDARSVRHVREAQQVIGVSANGDGVVRASLQTESELPKWPVAGLLAVTAFDFDNDGVDEIGIVSTSGIEVREATGTTIVNFPENLTAAEAERQPTPFGDSLSCLCSVAGQGNQYLVTINRYWQNAVMLPSQSSKNLVVSDLDSDGWHDVTTSWTGAAGGPIASFDALFHLGATQVPWFEYTARGGVNVILPHGTLPTANPAPPLMADLNGDGQTDSITALQGHGKFSFGDSPFAPGNVATVEYSGVYLYRQTSSVPHPNDDTSLRFDLTHSAVPASATHLELQAYRWDVLGGQAPSYVSEWHKQIPCPASSPPASIYAPIMIADDVFQHAVMFVLRYVRKEGGEVVRAWPPSSGTVTASSDIHAQLLNEPGVSLIVGGIGGVPTGGVTTITPLPNVEPPTGFEEDESEGGGED